MHRGTEKRNGGKDVFIDAFEFRAQEGEDCTATRCTRVARIIVMTLQQLEFVIILRSPSRESSTGSNPNRGYLDMARSRLTLQ